MKLNLPIEPVNERFAALDESSISKLTFVRMKMPPSNSSGRKLRFAMLPLSWGIVILVVYLVMVLLSKISSTSISELLRTRSFWPLAVLLPAIAFGKVLGLMILNLIAYSIPAARRVFNAEVAQTSRPSFRKAMKDLAIFTLVTGLATILGAALFLGNR